MWMRRKKPKQVRARPAAQDPSLELLQKLAQQTVGGPAGPARPGPAVHPLLSDSIKSVSTVGWTIIFLFFGVFGTWAAVAPLRGAVVANAFIKVEGNRKSVQHLDGGIVKQLNIKEGDQVKLGDVLIVLDD